MNKNFKPIIDWNEVKTNCKEKNSCYQAIKDVGIDLYKGQKLLLSKVCDVMFDFIITDISIDGKNIHLKPLTNK